MMKLSWITGPLLAGTLIGSLAAPLAAEPWKEVAQLPGGIAVSLDEASVDDAMDGMDMVKLGTFRREMPSGPMETDVAVNCQKETSKIRGVRLVGSGQVYNQQLSRTVDFTPVRDGSSEAIYFKALCGKEVSLASE